MGRIITAPGVLTNVQGQIDHALDLYQDIKDNNMKPLTVTLDPVTNANGSYTHITEDSRITEEMKAIAFEAGTPEVFLAPVTITTADGSTTLTCSNAVGTSTVTVTFVHTWPVDGGEDVPERVTSTEFDILADRIGSLSTLETTVKTSIVNAVNSLKNETDTHLTEVQDGLAIISNGDTHVAIPANQYVFVKNHNSLTNGLYKAKSAIGANAALSTNNLTADPAGGLNDIKSQIDTLNSNFARISLDPKTVLRGSDDMNNVDVGTYFQSGGSSSMPANSPSGSNNAFIMVVSARATDRIQFWYSINAGKLFIRHTNDWNNGGSSIWTEWLSFTPA